MPSAAFPARSSISAAIAQATSRCRPGSGAGPALLELPWSEGRGGRPRRSNTLGLIWARSQRNRASGRVEKRQKVCRGGGCRGIEPTPHAPSRKLWSEPVRPGRPAPPR